MNRNDDAPYDDLDDDGTPSDGSLEIVVHEVNTIWRWVLVENGVELHEGAALSQRTAQRNAEMVQRLIRHE